ncbi:phosphate transporter [Ilyonectria robusta]|uniref:phosphate transporter n=1 Tax=Ilyonectria robusta TaxID=1079257 RepID=UPI001E8E40A4|nr:phosphate transporter [Ilyonectria robusta]KAH8684132.1 phosphate transporter [Ilyonectria robusta]
MVVLHQYDYIFAIGTIFAFLDAWNIGANDVANSWSTSVSSRSLSYIQAMTLGSILEFAGSVGVGARVADTIRTKVVDIDQFESDPALLMLGMMCAVVASSIYLTICTRIGLPVSTTHSIMGGVIGMGIALVGADGIHWAELDKGISSGVVSVFLAWIIAPGLAGAFAAIIFLITKYGVMLRSQPVWKGLFLVPIYFGITASLLTMLIVWKGGSIKISFTDAETAGMIVGVGAAWALVIATFLVPWLYRLVIKDDWQLRWYHIPLGPLLLKRPEPPAQPEGAEGGIQNFYEGHLTREELNELRRAGRNGSDEFERADDENNTNTETKQASRDDSAEHTDPEPVERKEKKSIVGPKPDGPVYSPAVLFWYLKFVFLQGVDQDIVHLQNSKGVLSGDLEEIHANVPHYDNRTEYLYTFLQVMTAATASFTHGANDVSNAIGPYATIFQIWHTGVLKDSKSDVPVWILCFGGAAIALGIWTYGYNIMRNLGNRLTLHSPSRGFSMELGSAVTVILATRLKLPVSTTQCITGATVGVGLCSGTWRAINWRMVAWIYMGWFITLPVAGIISGCLCGIIVNAPRWGYEG